MWTALQSCWIGIGSSVSRWTQEAVIRIEDLIDGKLVCGAGGGGFLQVVLKKGIKKEAVEKRLKSVFMDSLVGVADCQLVW